MEFQEIGVFRSDIFDHNSIWLFALRRGWLQLGVCKTNSEYTEHNDSEKPDHLRPETMHRDLLAARFFHCNANPGSLILQHYVNRVDDPNAGVCLAVNNNLVLKTFCPGRIE